MNIALGKLQTWLLVGLAISLTFSMDSIQWTGLFIILVAVNSVVLWSLSRPVRLGESRKILILFVGFYLIHLLGLLDSANMTQAKFELEKKLAMLILPLAIYYSPKIGSDQLRTILHAFVAACFLSLMYCIAMATCHWMVNGDPTVLTYHSLSGNVGMHAAYLSMYCCMSIGILLSLHHEVLTASTHAKRKNLVYLLIVVFTIGVYLLSSRMQLIILWLGAMVYTVVRCSPRFGWKKSVILGGGIMVIAFLVALAFPVNRERLKQAINYKNQYSISSTWGEGQMRSLIWSCALDVIKTSPIIGVGIGDGEDALEECYVRNEYGSLTYFHNARFNAHSQVLETTIQLGLLGLAVFLLSILAPALFAWREENVLYVVFVLIFFLSAMSESMLERQSGIAFFSLFNSLLFFSHSGRNKEQITY